jgi:hypothetical protein
VCAAPGLQARNATTKSSCAAAVDGDGLRSSRASYAVGGPFIRQDGSAGPLERCDKTRHLAIELECESVVAARTHGQTTPRGVKFEAP